MTTKIEGLMGDESGTLIKYNEVFKKLKIPKKYLIDSINIWDVFVEVNLTTIKKLKLGEIIPDGIRTVKTNNSTIKLSKDDFKKKLGLKYEHFDVKMFFREKPALLRVYGYMGELQYYLDKDSEQVYFWVSEEDVRKWHRKLFVEIPSADKVRKLKKSNS